jgi:hypothetical protein
VDWLWGFLLRAGTEGRSVTERFDDKRLRAKLNAPERSSSRETQQQGDCHAKRHGSEQKDWRKSGHADEAKDEKSSRDYNSCNS